MKAVFEKKKFASWKMGIMALGLLLILGACSRGVPAEQVAAKDQEIASLQAQLASLQTDARYWDQLTGLYEPVTLRSMTDHRAYMLPSGVLMALHFDNPDLQKAQNLNWVALGIPGRNCRQDQEEIEKRFGAGFTHFHDLKRDTHGSTIPGVEGVWFVHVAVREFDSPMSGGHVMPGVDGKFMPTQAPVCS
jgi:hypothetical protein